MEVTEAFLIIKWEEFPALIYLFGLITSTDFEVSDKNLRRFPALLIMSKLEVIPDL